MDKVTVIGTTGTGKTTLIDKLKKEFESRGKTVEIVQEVARSSPWAINEDADFVGQRWVFHQQ
jgi:molybdopterin-guanine dinucleotide biosynthesis protein